MRKVKFTIGDIDFILTNTSMEYFGERTGVSHLALSEISDERVEAIARFMELAMLAEREACAVMCTAENEEGDFVYDTRAELAEAILARGNDKE